MELNLKGPPYPKRAHSRRCIHLVGRKGDQKLNSYLEVFATSLSLQCVCVCVFIQPYVRIYVRVCVHSCTFHPRLQFLVNSMVWTDTSVCRERIHVYVYLEEFVVDRWPSFVFFSYCFFFGSIRNWNSIFDCNLRENVYSDVRRNRYWGEGEKFPLVLTYYIPCERDNVITEASRKGRKQWQVVRK